MNIRTFVKRTCMLLALGLVSGVSLPAQTFTNIASLADSNGNSALGNLVQAADGSLYGTTSMGGANQQGTVFKVSPDGTVTTMYSFCSQKDCADGAQPYNGLVSGTNGNFYGTTITGGGSCIQDGMRSTCGTVFEITPDGELTTLYSFCQDRNGGMCRDGANPYTLVRAADGNLYGTTESGGSSAADSQCGCPGWGTIFRISPAGALTTLHSFCNQWTHGNCVDGAFPLGAVAEDSSGNLYGTTFTGGIFGNGGTIYKLTPTGQFTTLYSFCGRSCFEGSIPYAGLVQGPNGDFYGVTSSGGYHFRGTVFEITAKGGYKTLHHFGDGEAYGPTATLLLASDGDFYGTATAGGAYFFGAVFRVTPAGQVSTMYSFCSQYPCPDGMQPAGGLLQGSNGELYGVTLAGGAHNDGVVYSLSLGSGN